MRIYVPPDKISPGSPVTLDKEKSHYLISVMRCNVGDRITIINGKGKAYDAEVMSVLKKNVSLMIKSELTIDNESVVDIVLCQSILKGSNMDMVVQKAVELGAKKIIPIISERCLVKDTRKTSRWNKIAEEAAEQCGRAYIPEVSGPETFESFFEKRGNITGLIFWEQGGAAVRKILSGFSGNELYIFIGPEGGFSADEALEAERHGIIKATLGKRTLRAETAAIASLSIIQDMLE
ncbi:MAG: 16S rRNA (uracil(1498)-N(3))-methyltransferase [Nitrospirae bacterium]|nr:MAG: 16S rRNA (uracil(1498)-N(3))-methyltransferase [Nitrospirota bacterium]